VPAGKQRYMSTISEFFDEYRNGVRIRQGEGHSIAQYGELFQGQTEHEGGRRRRCLVSLPCSALYSHARFHPDGAGSLRVSPPYKKKALRVMELTFARLGASDYSGTLFIESTVPEAKGCGSSTADCVAAARACADALNRTLKEEEVARLVVEAEVASDNFMFHRAVLFAHREGEVLEDYAIRQPRLEVLGIDTRPDGAVETLKYPPAEYSWRQRQSFCLLTAALRRAMKKHDVRLLGRVARASACINQEFLPKPMFREINEIVEDTGALGLAVAHSGTVLSILLDPSDQLLEKKVDQVRARLNELGISQILRFQT
jgi:uncharacterized protein involved in propanediol utilization